MATRILIADDNEINRDFLETVLATEGYEVVTVSDGMLAIRACEEGVFDLVLMDIRMPEVDGVAATERIRELPGYRAVPILALTADLQLQQRDPQVARGFAAVLAKPIARHELLQAVAARIGPAPAPTRYPTPPPGGALDRASALAAAGGNAELATRLLAMLGSELERFAPAIRVAVERNDRPTARELTHKLRASAGFCGARALGEAAGRLEHALTLPDARPIPEALGEFLAAVAAFQAANASSAPSNAD